MNDITALSPVTPEMLASLKLSAINLAEGEMMSFEPAVFQALVEALEAKEEQRANWLKMAQELGEKLDAADKRIVELERYQTAFTEWHEKTEWVQTDKRFGVIKPWGKHRADVLKAYVEYLESRPVAVKLPAAWWVKQGPQELLAYEKQMLLDALTTAGIQVIEGEGQ